MSRNLTVLEESVTLLAASAGVIIGSLVSTVGCRVEVVGVLDCERMHVADYRDDLCFGMLTNNTGICLNTRCLIAGRSSDYSIVPKVLGFADYFRGVLTGCNSPVRIIIVGPGVSIGVEMLKLRNLLYLLCFTDYTCEQKLSCGLLRSGDSNNTFTPDMSGYVYLLIVVTGGFMPVNVGV